MACGFLFGVTATWWPSVCFCFACHALFDCFGSFWFWFFGVINKNEGVGEGFQPPPIPYLGYRNFR